MRKNITKFITALFMGMLFLSGSLSVAEASDVVTYEGEGTDETEVTLRLVTMEGEILFDDDVLIVDDEPTVYMALRAAADAEDIDVDIVDESDPENLFVNGISDLISENPNYWMIYVNQEAAEVGMGMQEVEDGDLIEFIYGDFNEGYVNVVGETITYIGEGDTETEVNLRLVTMEGEIIFDDQVLVVDDNPTVYMALLAASEAEGIEIDITDESDPNNLFINGISDLYSENPNYWMIYLNGEAAENGMGIEPIEEDDTVEFLYGDFNEGYVEVAAE